MFPYVPTKREIRHFHVVVILRRLRNEQKKGDARADLLFCHATRGHRGSWAHVRLLRTKNFQKLFSTKKHVVIPATRGRDKRLTWPYGFGAFMVNRCAVVWCGRELWVETAHSHLPCFALRRKTTPNKQRAAKRYKMAMNWAHVTQKKQQQAQVYVSTIYFYIYAYISTFLSTTWNFSYKVFKSFVICKTVSKFAVIHAPSLGRLCLSIPIGFFTLSLLKLPNVLMRSFNLVDTKRVFFFILKELCHEIQPN